MSEQYPDEPSIAAARAARSAELAGGDADPVAERRRALGGERKGRPTSAEDIEMGNIVALFVDDHELRRRINPKVGRDRFRAAVRAAEHRGFPKIHSLWLGRYWPAVKAWLDSDNGLTKNEFCSDAEDGPEDFDARTR
jgi:hypothetical protein